MKNKIIKKKYKANEIKLYIIFFIWSITIAIAYIYFIFGKGYIMTA